MNLKTTPEALSHLLDEKNIRLFESHKVYSKAELTARYEVLNESYGKIINIEALTMLDMARKDILPAMSEFAKKLSKSALEKKEFVADVDLTYEKETVKKLGDMTKEAYKHVLKLEEDLSAAKDITSAPEYAMYCKDKILPDMAALRISVDSAEAIASKKDWPYPSYGELLFGVR